MKIVISGYYGFNNSGDDALLKSIINNIKEVDEKAEITVLSKNPKETRKGFGVNSIGRYNFFTVPYKIATCDLLISGGGSLIQDATSTKSLYYYLSIIKMAKIFRRKVMLYANGIGPLTSFKNIEKTKNILNEVDVITLRDEMSFKEIEQIGVNQPEIKVSADPVFLLQADNSADDILETYGIPKDKKLLCISVRKYKKNIPNFEEVMAQFCDYACEKYDLFPVFLPMQQRVDYAISASIKNKMKSRGVVIGGNHQVPAILSLMDKMHICVGMRLHTLIYASSGGVPVIGIVYDPKVSGFLEYLNVENSVNACDVTFDKLCENLDKVCENYDSVSFDVKYNVRLLRAKAQENVEYLKTLLSGGNR